MLLGVVLLHLTFVESGYACQMPAGAMSGPVAARMQMGMQMAAGGGIASPTGATPTQQHSPCRFPWAPDGCQSAAPCAPVALVSGAVTLRPITSTQSAPSRVAPLARTFLRLPPEPPPPRA